MIRARHYAAALTYLGADVESALLELASGSPTLDTLLRKELFRHCEKPQLRWIRDRSGGSYMWCSTHLTRETCAMHAIDQLTRFFDNEVVVKYLKSQFPEHDVEELMCS